MIFHCVIFRIKKWVTKHATEQSCISEYINVAKSRSTPNCQNSKKSCVTPFHRIPRNKDQKRRFTFLCRKTLPNVEYMYVCGWGTLRDRQVHCLS